MSWSIEIENRLLPLILKVKTMQLLCRLIQMSHPDLLLIGKMIVSELRWQINFNPSPQLSTGISGPLLFFKKSCRISTVSSGGTIIMMKMIFCLPYFTFIISLSTHTHTFSHTTPSLLSDSCSLLFLLQPYIFSNTSYVF